jgi:hypothetical protein
METFSIDHGGDDSGMIIYDDEYDDMPLVVDGSAVEAVQEPYGRSRETS